MGGSSSFKMCLNLQIFADPLPVECYFIITEGPSVTAVRRTVGVRFVFSFSSVP